MKLAYIYQHDGNGYAAAVRELGGVVAKGGRKAIDAMLRDGFEAVICECTLLGDADYSDSKTPLLLVDPFDGSQLRDRHRLKWPSVRAVLKRSCLCPPRLNNEWGDRYHVKMLTDAGVQCKQPLEDWRRETPLQLTDAELAKVYPFVSFACHPTMKGAAEKGFDLDAGRQYSVHFAGTTSYSGTVVQEHRLAAFSAALQAPRPRVAFRDRTLGIKHYRNTLRDARCVLSPWGWGETCYRDFEAWFCGSVLVKPTMRHVATWPRDLFVPGETFVECSMMFENASEIIAKIERDWTAYNDMRQTAYERALLARDRKALAGRLKAIMDEVL